MFCVFTIFLISEGFLGFLFLNSAAFFLSHYLFLTKTIAIGIFAKVRGRAARVKHAELRLKLIRGLSTAAGILACLFSST